MAGGLGTGDNVNVGGYVQTGNLNLVANTISTTNTNGNLNVAPNGAGNINLTVGGTADVLLSHDPIALLAAATKQYVLNRTSLATFQLCPNAISVVATSYDPTSTALAYFTWINSVYGTILVTSPTAD